MRRQGIWHPRLIQVLTALGHGDTIVVADAGLPVPRHVEVIDLVWAAGQPDFVPVLRAIVDEAVVESAVVANELSDATVRTAVQELFAGDALLHVSHDELKRLTGEAVAVVRTGAITPYANVILVAGVPFGAQPDQ